MFIEVTPFARVRILEKQNRLQMSQVFSCLSINHQMALLFKDSKAMPLHSRLDKQPTDLRRN